MRKVFRLLRYDYPLFMILNLTNWLPDSIIFLRFRGILARFFFKKAGMNLRLGRNLTFYNPSKIILGRDVYIAEGNWFSAGEEIIVGDEVIFGPKSVIVSSNHTFQGGSYRFSTIELKPIFIGKGCWIAAQCTITAGSYIGDSTLIAANTVCKGFVPRSVLYGGTPGKIIRVND
jgi:acetyltransferase-like isoleucine patch superfamily enzyme